mmetsp:Transcript_103479/g.267808  ORF Transcript_103479/g.267808 Transcript_103479/m.267808 type:complete len:209 (-) Transcript_103479:201-827(-)
MSIVPPLAAELLQSLALLAVDTHLGHLHGRHIWSSEQRRRETLLGLEDVVVPPGRYEDGDAELHAPRSWCALALQLDAREVGEGGPDEDPHRTQGGVRAGTVVRDNPPILHDCALSADPTTGGHPGLQHRLGFLRRRRFLLRRRGLRGRDDAPGGQLAHMQGPAQHDLLGWRAVLLLSLSALRPLTGAARLLGSGAVSCAFGQFVGER